MKVAIVGAGPVGCRVAELLARSGHEVQVFEEHPRIGTPLHCTGIVSPRLLELVKTRSVLAKPSRALIFGADVEFPIQGKAYVLDRQKFDLERYRAAVKAGASFLFDARPRFDGTDLFLHYQRIKADAIIGADGSRSSIRSFYRFVPHLLPAAQYIVSGRFDARQVQIHLWPQYHDPGLFTWVVPLSRLRAKIGVACTNPLPHLHQFIHDRFPRARIEKRMAGTVMTGGPVRQDYGRVKLVGDAAGHVKATTGGGLVAGLWCAEKLAESLDKGLDYTRLCRPVLRELHLSHWLRIAWDRLSGETRERILVSLSKNASLLEKTDMDWHAGSLMRIASKEFSLLPRVLADLLM